MLYPLGLPSAAGASNAWRASKERLEDCSRFPEKCINPFKIVQIEGGFEVESSRPDAEVTTVNWAFVLSTVIFLCLLSLPPLPPSTSNRNKTKQNKTKQNCQQIHTLLL
jgi:hypothetical protein